MASPIDEEIGQEIVGEETAKLNGVEDTPKVSQQPNVQENEANKPLADSSTVKDAKETVSGSTGEDEIGKAADSSSTKDVLAKDAPNSSTAGEQKGKRPMCDRCQRPAKVCICESLPKSPIQLKKCHVIVLQHPLETKRRKNISLPLIQLCLDPSSITVVVSRRFGDQVDPAALKLLKESPKVLLVFPAQEDQEVATHESNQTLTLSEARKFCDEQEDEDSTLETPNDRIVIVMLDATWKFAKEMDKSNILTGYYPKHMKRVALSWEDPLRPAQAVVPCRFDIRTAPSEVHLSTAECIAWMLTALEDKENKESDDSIYNTLMKPLDCMVAKWHDCRQNATENHGRRRKKKKKGKQQEDEKPQEERDYSYYGNPEHANLPLEEEEEPPMTRASFFTQGDDDRGGSKNNNSKKRRRK